MTPYGSMEWDHYGRAIWRETSERPCPGPVWSKTGCTGRWYDEYDSAHDCPICVYGNGRQVVIKYTRCPQFDAPQPPKGWTPAKSAREIIDSIYGG